jgi:hypothetical protein
VKRINANKRPAALLIDYRKAKTRDRYAEAGRRRGGRIVVCDPAPIPIEEMQRTYAWLKSWGMLEETASPLELVDVHVQAKAHSEMGYRA